MATFETETGCGHTAPPVNNSTAWFKTEQIKTFVGYTDEYSNLIGTRNKLIVMHQCGDDKQALIEQLKTMIHGIEREFDYFGG